MTTTWREEPHLSGPVAIRTTFLVGHPGESEAAFERLAEFVKQAEFDHMGAFTFSREEGTVAALLPNRVTAKVAKQRRTQLMRLQRAISRTKMKALVGKELEVLVEGVSDESEYLLQGRWAGQAPEIDGRVYLTDGTAQAGDLVRARITSFADYDLAGEIVSVTKPRGGRVRATRLPVVA